MYVQCTYCNASFRHIFVSVSFPFGIQWRMRMRKIMIFLFHLSFFASLVKVIIVVGKQSSILPFADDKNTMTAQRYQCSWSFPFIIIIIIILCFISNSWIYLRESIFWLWPERMKNGYAFKLIVGHSLTQNVNRNSKQQQKENADCVSLFGIDIKNMNIFNPYMNKPQSQHTTQGTSKLIKQWNIIEKNKNGRRCVCAHHIQQSSK